MKNKKSLWWIVAVITLPFVVMLGLHIGIALGNYFRININVPNVNAATWFMFFGSYLGGVMTLGGVMITLRHERNIFQYQNAIENIEREKEKIGNAVCGFNLLSPGVLYMQVNELLASSVEVSASDMATIRLHVNEEMHRALAIRTELEFATDIYSMAGNCAVCKKPCRVQSILPEFIKTYDLIGAKIYDTLSKINDYILTCERNRAYRRMNGCENQIVDLKLYQDEISAALNEITKFNQNEIQRLVFLGKEYIEQKKQNAYKNCFSIKDKEI